MAYEILILSDLTHDLRVHEVMFSDTCNRIDICDSDTELDPQRCSHIQSDQKLKRQMHFTSPHQSWTQ